MSSETSMVAASFRLQEWAAQIRECQNRPGDVSVASWCADHGITKANYYYRLHRVRKACLEHMQEEIPAQQMDNNAAEQSIRGFCIGKKNWVMIDTVTGAKSSAIIYSIAETAKANNLKLYDYFEHLLSEIPKHLDDTDRSFLDDLLPWSPKLPANCRKTGKEVK